MGRGLPASGKSCSACGCARTCRWRRACGSGHSFSWRCRTRRRGGSGRQDPGRGCFRRGWGIDPFLPAAISGRVRAARWRRVSRRVRDGRAAIRTAIYIVSAMFRSVCLRCKRPESHCLCASIPALAPRTRVVVLQHPSEARHPLNTARLAVLGLAGARLLVGSATRRRTGWRPATRRTCCFPVPGRGCWGRVRRRAGAAHPADRARRHLDARAQAGAPESRAGRAAARHAAEGPDVALPGAPCRHRRRPVIHRGPSCMRSTRSRRRRVSTRCSIPLNA